MKIDCLEFDDAVEVKIYRADGWRWEPARVIDPTSTPIVVETSDGIQLTPTGGRIRRKKKSDKP